MKDTSGCNFTTINGLISIIDLPNSPYKPLGFDLDNAIDQIKSQGLEPEDFYYDPKNEALPFCYYRGAVILDFSAINNLEEIKTLIARKEKQFNDCVAKRDFDSFFSLLDNRVVPDLFMESFNFIPDEHKYRLFKQIIRNNEHSTQVFSPDFIKKVCSYKGVTSTRPIANEKGYVKAYLGTAAGVEPVSCSWTTDINIAILRALEWKPVGTVYQGQINQKHIREYNPDRFKKEVKIEPFWIEDIEIVLLFNLDEIKQEIEAAGVVERYYYYTGQIDESWFHNPEGIHARSHTKRVLFLILLISYLEKFNEQDRHLLCLCAIYHDIGRLTDGYDPEHGIASYKKILALKLDDSIDNKETEVLRFIIENHAIPDRTAYKKLDRYKVDDPDRTIKLYAAFKDADGLERVRINDLSSEYLRTDSSPKLMLLARQLYNLKEYENFNA